MMHASDVHHGIKRMMGKLRSGTAVAKEEWIDFLDGVSYRNSQILTAARFATKGGYKQQSSEVEADLSVYVRDYIETVSTLWAPRGVSIEATADGKPVTRKFRPIEIGIVIDNLVSNAVKAKASTISFDLSSSKGSKPELRIVVADDGKGCNDQRWIGTWPLPRKAGRGNPRGDDRGHRDSLFR
jgi:signal transduction histidine kinase